MVADVGRDFPALPYPSVRFRAGDPSRMLGAPEVALCARLFWKVAGKIIGPTPRVRQTDTRRLRHRAVSLDLGLQRVKSAPQEGRTWVCESDGLVS